MMRFKLLNTEIYISFLFSATVTVMIFFDRSGCILPLIFSVVMHEVGHLAAMHRTGCAPKRIRLVPAAVEITRPFGVAERDEIFISLCGPASNLLLFSVFVSLFSIFKSERLLEYAIINLFVGCFNLLPAKGLDGGTVLHAIICRKAEHNKAEIALKASTAITALLFLCIGIALSTKGALNLSFFIIALYLVVIGLIKK